MAFRFLPGYPCPNEKGGIDMLVDLDGPASYIKGGSFSTSGQQINAADLGVGGFEDIGSDQMSSDGANVIEVVLGATIAGATNLNPAPPAGQPAIVATTAVLHWFTDPTRGTEVTNGTNLSGKSVRLRIVAV
jgi:hypothetical protein